jgi:hypothetical protein
MAKPLKGYKAFRIGTIAVDGGMGTALAALGTTVKGTVNATSSEATMQDFFIEEVSGAFDSAVTEDPILSGTLEIYDVHPDTAMKVFGGTSTVTGVGAAQRAVFTPPAVYTPKEVSGEIESKNGAILAVVRMQLAPVWNLSFQDGELGKIVVNWKALAPLKAETMPYTLSVPSPVA